MPRRAKQSITLINWLCLRDPDDFVRASEAAKNPDLAFGDPEMLSQ